MAKLPISALFLSFRPSQWSTLQSGPLAPDFSLDFGLSPHKKAFPSGKAFASMLIY